MFAFLQFVGGGYIDAERLGRSVYFPSTFFTTSLHAAGNQVFGLTTEM